MITGVHAMFYSSDADALRGFLREKLGLPATDVGDGWLIFGVPTAEIGVHPTEGDPPAGTHDISFTTDDVRATVRALAERGVKCEPIQDQGYGLVTSFTMPGGVRAQLYQPAYHVG
jgi:catechol 2,3-dioxygenase-like lactoylglutathione lyase family enzyme